MNTLYRNGKLKLSVYADHNPPHFHVRTPDGESLVLLETHAEKPGGKANRKLLAEAISWAIANKSLLETEWNRLNL